MARHAEALVEISAHHRLEILDAILEEMVRLGNDRMLDDDALLGLQLLDEGEHFLQRRDAILVPMHEQARRRTGGKKTVIETVGGRRYRDEALDFWPPHQKLHADPGSEGN